MQTERRRRWIFLGVVGVVLLLFPWPSEEPALTDDAGPTPSASRTARSLLRAAMTDALPQASDPDDEDEDDEESRRTEYLVVALRSAHEGFLFFRGEGRMDPNAFWPLEDASPFPESATADALQALLLEPDAEAERDWVALADAEGFSSAGVDEAGDPWSAVLALEVERRAAVRAYADAYADAWEGRPAQPWTRPHPPLPAQRVLGMPAVDPVLELADDLIAAHPDHPAGEFARLYLLDALAMSGAEDAWSEGLGVLRETEDPLVLTQAAQLLATLPGDNRIEMEDLDRLGTVYEDAWDLTDCLHLSAFGLEQAMMRGDGDRTRDWLGRFEQSTRDACGQSESPRCQMYRDNLDAAVALLGERDVADAETWQQAFEIASWSCARDLPIPTRVVGRASWTGGWDWEPWQCDGTPCRQAYTSCVEAHVDHGPVPEVDVDVRLTVVGEVGELGSVHEREG